MALIFRLANLTQTTVYDLLNGTLRLVENSWETRTPAVQNDFKTLPFGGTASFKNYDRVQETMGLIGADTVGNLLTAANAIEAFQELARRWHNDPLQSASAWLEFNASGEGARRSLIYDLALTYGQMVGITPTLAALKLQARLSLTRHPLWEATSADTYTNLAMSTLGGTAILTTGASVVPARIKEFRVNGVAYPLLYRVWAGLREANLGTAHFSAVWECENAAATMGTDATRQTGGAGSGGGWVDVIFATPTACQRWSMRVGDTGAYAEEYLGTYQVLCRCKVTAGTVALQFRAGATSTLTTPATTPNELVYVTNTAYRLIPLGEFQIPAAGYRAAQYDPYAIQFTEAQIWAERIDGAGTLALDCIVLIPAGHTVKAVGANIYTDPGPEYYPLKFYTHENDTTAAVAKRGPGEPAVNLEEATFQDWYLPNTTALLVVAAEAEDQHVLGSQVDTILTAYKRFLSYRAG